VTERTFPSGIREADPDKLARVWRRAGGDWVVPAGEVLLADREGLTGTPLAAFDITTSASSFDVEIQPGEAVVVGVWLGKDTTTTTVSLSSQVSNQTIYLGWDATAGNDVLIGTDSEFSTTEPADQRIPIWEVDTGGSGVTAARDQRPLGEQIDTRNEGSVAEADHANSVDGSDVDGQVASAQLADTANSVDGSDVNGQVSDSDALDGKDSSAFVLDQSPIEGLAIGTDANRSDGYFAALSASDSIEFASYQTESDVPTLEEDEMVYVSDEQEFYFENGGVSSAKHADVADDLAGVTVEKLKGLGSLTGIGTNSNETSSLHAENNIDILDFMPYDGEKMELRHGGQNIISGTDPQHGSFSNPLYSGGSGYYILDSGYTDNEGSIRYTVY